MTSILNYFDHHDKQAGKEHFLYLVRVANADGVVDKKESDFLHRMGRNLGFTEPEIDNLMQVKDSKVYTPPYDLEERFHLLYDVVAMALADGIVFPNEMQLIKKLAIASGFNDDDSEHIINLLINGIKYEKNEEELFLLFKKRK